jgi:hypothetical protein
MGNGTELDDALFGLPGFRVLAVTVNADELLVGIETFRQAAASLTDEGLFRVLATARGRA